VQSKNKKTPTAKEKTHIENVKSLPCSVCFALAPSDCHEINQGQWYTSIALCKDCHQGSFNGLHGQKRAWILRKMTELDALNKTIQNLVGHG
jgi:hypothetical protein